MKNTLLYASAITFLSLSSQAETIPSLGGYEEVEITKVEPDGLRVMHKHGTAKIKFVDLPEDVRKKYNYDKSKAEAFRKSSEQAAAKEDALNKLSLALMDANFAADAKVLQVLPNGVLLSNIVWVSGKKIEQRQLVQSGTKLGTNNALDNSQLPEYEYKSKWVRPASFQRGPVYVECNTKGMIDGERFRAIVFPSGNFSYTNTVGGAATVSGWTVYPDSFAQAEGLGAVRESTITELQALHPNFPPIARGAFAKAESATTTTFGSGAVIADGTYIVTCAHVVEGKENISVSYGSSDYKCSVVTVDGPNDIAILKLATGKLTPAPIQANTAEVGETIFTMGFPNPEIQGREPKMTDGKVSSHSGIKGNKNELQITVAVQPGNSGGGLFNLSGQIVGVVTSKLSATAGLATSGALPENVNYAVKATHIIKLLETNGISVNPVRAASSVSPPLTEAVKNIRTAVVQVTAKSK